MVSRVSPCTVRTVMLFAKENFNKLNFDGNHQQHQNFLIHFYTIQYVYSHHVYIGMTIHHYWLMPRLHVTWSSNHCWTEMFFSQLV